jgi:hypothetical protein
MRGSLTVWLLLAAGFIAANLPFLTERLLLVGPRLSPKHFGWRLLELLLLAAVMVGIGLVVESRIGQRHPQGWQFYAVALCLFITFGFPGFVWRHLRRHRPVSR